MSFAAPPPLPRSFFTRDVVTVARELLGKTILRVLADGTLLAGRITETEAYLSSADSANHAARGPTPRTMVMFGEPGLAYVYHIHQQFCLNVVTEPAGVASAVLLRGIEPLSGEAVMRQLRGKHIKPSQLTNGPGKLCQALAITKHYNGSDLTDATASLRLCDSLGDTIPEIIATPRIGVTSAKDLLLRFIIAA
jgi:DNA-3-methyladenine glycosylase